MEKKNNKLTSNLWVKDGLDVPFLCIMLVLMAFGLIMLLSASYAYSYYETDGDSSLHFFFRQLIFMGGGSVVVGIVSHIDYKKYVYLSNFALLVACVLVAITIMIGKKEGGEINRWLSFGFFDIQPSEIAKFAIVVFCAAGLDKNHKKMISSKPSKNIVAQKIADFTSNKIVITEGTVTLFFYFFWVVFTAGLVFLGSHLSGAILIMLFGVAMLWIGEGRARWFAIGVVAVAVVLFIAINFYEDLPIKDYMKERIASWLVKDLTDTDKRWQINHSLFALGSGGFFGAGLGNSKQKYFYVSEAHTDFIFSIIGEELGFVGCCLVLALFSVLILRGIYIGMHAKDRFGALLVFGIMMQIGLQVVLNVAVVTDTLPNTGISLPFFSYGGSSTLVTLGEMGIVLGVSRQANLPKYSFSAKPQKKPNTK
ncbi:MAG: cell division protein FtsW [Clostridia bacterium]|nr:cell division protein FtsW [Clostridia bacterium]MBP3559575.1 cell division protein FtsW [Clostridia bacterium]